MGVDTRCHLSNFASLEDVAKAIAILSGTPPKKHFFGEDKKTWTCEVPNGYHFSFHLMAENEAELLKKLNGEDNRGIGSLHIETKDTSFLNPSIVFNDILGHQRNVMFFLENSDGYKMLSPRSNPFWLAVTKELVNIFGGKLFYSDHGELETPDVLVENGKLTKWHYEDGNDGFRERNSILLNIKPLSKQDYLLADKSSAYKINENQESIAYWTQFLSATDAINEKNTLKTMQDKIKLPRNKKVKL